MKNKLYKSKIKIYNRLKKIFVKGKTLKVSLTIIIHNKKKK